MSIPPLRFALPRTTSLHHILVVEDDPADRRLLGRLLRDLGDRPDGGTTVSVSWVDRLARARTHLGRRHVDLALLDLSLPDSTGLDTLLAFRAMAPETSVIVLAKWEDDAISVDALHAGAQDYVVMSELTTALLVRAVRYATARRELQEALQRLALTDELTELRNRRAFTQLGEEQLHLGEHLGQDVVLFAFDVDGLKRINDELGHATGDRAIRAAADALRRIFRRTDLVARVGGDEFAALVVDAPTTLERDVRYRLDHARALSMRDATRRRRRLRVSMGTARATPTGRATLSALWSAADHALYLDKRAQRSSTLAG